MCARWYVEGPHVYILTFMSSRGLNGSVFLVKVLYTLSRVVLLLFELFKYFQCFFYVFFGLKLR